jgi:SHS2 domain-containing protein
MNEIKDFEVVPHIADLQLHVYGNSLQELFTHALQGMFQAVKPVSAACTTVNDRLVCPSLPIERDTVVESPDINALLVDFLSDALYLSDVHNEAYLDVAIAQLTTTKIVARFKGVPIEGLKESEIKAVTYHDLHIEQKDGVWETNIVFDI